MGVKLRPFSIQIGGGGGGGGPLAITTTSPLPAGTVAIAPYAQALIATGGTQPYTWTLQAGALPGGLTLAANGLLSGTPTSSGVFTPTFRVTDALGAFKNLLASITISGASLFTDSFARADNVYGYNQNWFLSRYGSLGSTGGGIAFAMLDQIRISTNAASIGASAANFTLDVGGIFIIPVPILTAFPTTANQYCQVTFLSSNNVAGVRGVGGGPGVLLNWGLLTAAVNGYLIEIDRSASGGPAYNMNLCRLDTTSLALMAGSIVAGDVIRLEATINAGDVTLVTKVNGVVINTTVDANAARSTFGYPAIVEDGLSRGGAPGAASQIRMNNFDCGVI